MKKQALLEHTSRKVTASTTRVSERLRLKSEPNELNSILLHKNTEVETTKTTVEPPTSKGTSTENKIPKENQDQPEVQKKPNTQPIDKNNQIAEQIEPARNTRNQNTNTENKPTNIAKMNQIQIQQSIASFVPEFSGEDTPNRSNELTRFIGTGDSIYETLKTEDERKIFDRLIKFRLTGDAYIRINHRNVTNYTELRNILNNMYAKTYSLDELERQLINTQQTYGETIRNYGYRLLEALEKYKTAYKIKYKLDNIDQTYSNHLNITSVQTFKRGLNNIILKEKIATIRETSVDGIVNEAEAIEKMLIDMTQNTITHTVNKQAPPIQADPAPTQRIPQKPLIICNYCQKANHTWDICRTRINQEQMRRATQMQQNVPRQRNYYNQLPNTYYNVPKQEPYHRTNQLPQTHYNPQNTERPLRQNLAAPPQKFANNQQYNRSPQQQQNQFIPEMSQPQFRTNQYRSNFAPKYCSHCKTTTGHTYEECRSKFFTRQSNPQPQINQNNPPTPPDTNALTDTFNKMRINTIFPQQMHNNHIPTQQSQPENSNGSDQP